MLINKESHQRESFTEWPIRLALRWIRNRRPKVTFMPMGDSKQTWTWEENGKILTSLQIPVVMWKGIKWKGLTCSFIWVIFELHWFFFSIIVFWKKKKTGFFSFFFFFLQNSWFFKEKMPYIWISFLHLCYCFVIHLFFLLSLLKLSNKGLIFLYLSFT